MKARQPRIILVLPLAMQMNVIEYTGIIRYIREHGLKWHIRLDRLFHYFGRPTIGDKDTFDGAIIDGGASPGLIKAYVSTHMPLVALDWRHPDLGRGRRKLVRINSDNRMIGIKAAATLQENGPFSSYAFLPISDDIGWSNERWQSFSAALSNDGIDAVRLDPKQAIGPQLRALTKPAALLTANDTVGDWALSACAEEGIAVPEDLSVLSVDNENLVCLHADPPLASIQPDFEMAGYMAAAALHAMLEGRKPKLFQRYHIKQIVPRRSMEPARSAGRLVQRAIDLIHNSSSKIKSVDEIAVQLGISRRLLDLRFRQVLSKSVLQTIQESRLEKVCTLLKTTNLSINESFASATDFEPRIILITSSILSRAINKPSKI